MAIKDTVTKSFSLDIEVVKALYALKEVKNVNLSRFVNKAIREKLDRERKADV